MFTTTEVRSITVDGAQLRVAVRPGRRGVSDFGGSAGPGPRVPLLLINGIGAGDDDPIIPLANARLMKLLIPKSRLHVYRGGHLGLVTEAAELAPVVDGFLASTEGDSDSG
jgi:hypothetical protein